MKNEHTLAALCAAFKVTLAGYHAWRRAQQDAALWPHLQAVYAQHRGRYGAPRIQRELRRQGRHHGRKRIARLMRDKGLRVRQAKRFVPRTTDSNHDQPIAPNRLATAPPPAPNQK